ncbi:MAG: FAD-binding protein [Eggerthella lenta]
MLSTTSGKGIVDNLIAEAEKNGVEIMMETRAIEVLMDGGKAAGVKARQGKTEYTINAKAVMLASGGFDGQDWAKELYAPGAVGCTRSPAPATPATASSWRSRPAP